MSCLSFRAAFATLTLLFTVTLPLVALAQTAQNQKCRDPVENCDPATNYFPDDERITIEYANETIPELVYSNVYVDMTVNFTFTNFTDMSTRPETRKYRLVKCGCEAELEQGRTQVYLNPNAVYLDDSVSTAMIDDIDPELTALKYIRSADYKFNKVLRDKVAAGTVNEATPAQLASDAELSAIIDNKFGAFGSAVEVATDGTPAIIIAEADERSPIARAEWIKFFGLYFNNAKGANDLFNAIVTDYNAIVEKARSATRRPSVFFNAPFPGVLSSPFDTRYTWGQPGGRTYMAQYMRDANADYRFGNDTNEDSPTPTTAEIAGNFTSAHYLVNADYFPGGAGRTMKDFVTLGKPSDEADKELQSFLTKMTAVRCGNVVSQSLRVVETSPGETANDFFEKAVVRPDLLLADYVSILHPNVDLGTHNRVFLYEYGEDRSLNLTCPFASLVGEPRTGTVHVDKMLEIEGADRYTVQDGLESKVFPRLEESGVDVARTDFQFPYAESTEETTTRLLVRQEVASDKKSETEDSTGVVESFRSGLGLTVKEVANGGEQSPDASKEGDSGLSVGAIIGIITGCIFGTLFVIGLCIFWQRGRTRPEQYAEMESGGEFPVSS